MKINTIKMSSSGEVMIPNEMRGDILEGDELIIARKDDKMILQKSLSDLSLLSEDSFAETWLNEGEDKAWEGL